MNIKETSVNHYNGKKHLAIFFALATLSWPYTSHAGNEHGHGGMGSQGGRPMHAGGMMGHQDRGHMHNEPMTRHPNGGNVHTGGVIHQNRNIPNRQAGYNEHGHRGHYYHSGRYYNYYHNNSYYNYYHNGAYYNYFFNGAYYLYFVNGAYYNYYYNGEYYNDCQKVPGYWSHGHWNASVMVCR